jgi:hypothetical protein
VLNSAILRALLETFEVIGAWSREDAYGGLVTIQAKCLKFWLRIRAPMIHKKSVVFTIYFAFSIMIWQEDQDFGISRLTPYHAVPTPDAESKKSHMNSPNAIALDRPSFVCKTPMPCSRLQVPSHTVAEEGYLFPLFPFPGHIPHSSRVIHRNSIAAKHPRSSTCFNSSC